MFFSVAYVFWYHIGVGASVHDKYQAEVTAHIEAAFEQDIVLTKGPGSCLRIRVGAISF